MNINKKNKIKKNTIVFVPMSADIVHHGHINLLKKASKYGKIVVGLMTDNGIKSYKKKRPLIKYLNRKTVVESLTYVHRVIPINGLEYVKFAKKYKFDFFIHGDDWKKGPQSYERKELKKIMKEWNGKVIDLPYTKGVSSTKIKKYLDNDIKKI